MYFDENKYWKYTNDVCSYSTHPTKEDIPYLLEHIFDLDKADYVHNPNQACYYNPVDISDYKFSTEHNDIISIEDNMLIGENIGHASVIVTDGNGESFKFKVIVTRDDYNGKTDKGILFLKRDNMIDLEIVLKHIHCKHYNNCIWERSIWSIYDDDKYYGVFSEINRVKELIVLYNNIIDEYRNNNIIYHPSLDDQYNIRIDKKIVDGETKHTVNVTVKKTFLKHIKNKIKECNLTLRLLSKQKKVIV